MPFSKPNFQQFEILTFTPRTVFNRYFVKPARKAGINRIPIIVKEIITITSIVRRKFPNIGQ